MVCAERLAKGQKNGRRERGIWAGNAKRIVGPPDSGSSTSGSYVVSCTDARPSPPSHFLPSAASSPVAPACCAPGKNSAAPKRTFSSALVSARWRAQRENDRRNQFIHQRLSSVAVQNAERAEPKRTSIPSIHFLDIDM